ncbi:hypothetical protein [Brevibacillus sp. NRS-1366]|uniref:hypothetical protein n=1 Tax=Brevibacillus sp. NRS-1366 TaxID=3233899 RepID=UPI003D209E8D
MVGKQMHEIHKPRVERSLLSGVVVFLAIGLFTMYGVQVDFILLDFAAIASYLFLVSAAGIILTRMWRYQGAAVKLSVLILLPGSLFILSKSHVDLMLYLVGVSTLIVVAKGKWKEKSLFLLAGTVTAVGV